jgi:hypothetical protein
VIQGLTRRSHRSKERCTAAPGAYTIRQSDRDCTLSWNIYDDEFDEDTTELPPSRPLIGSTKISYIIAKHHLTVMLERILELMESGISQEDAEKFGVELDEI